MAEEQDSNKQLENEDKSKAPNKPNDD